MPEEISNLKLKKIPVSEPSKEDKEFMETRPASRPPSFDADDKQMPEIIEWEQDDTYRFVIDARMASKRSDKRGTRSAFDIIAYKPIKKKSYEEMTDKEFGEVQGQELDKASKKK